MNKKNYAVTTKCGHVGRGKCYIVTFAIKAENGKEAAELARWIPRVKHDNKSCIVDVKEISEESYNILREENKNNPYLKCKNVQEQRTLCPEIYDSLEIVYEQKKDYSQERKDRVDLIKKRRRIFNDDIKNYFRYINTEMEYEIA